MKTMCLRCRKWLQLQIGKNGIDKI
ncbi:unnamed protein product [Cuscuta europaea]|uniref:Uncharacterized protein n=1 Tax=Cuscuta europaea TaxID=41803 RepID=A0A9P0ZUT4_CUSEU|nr:unnamed protein product [Cuscuta europaea]